MALNNTYHTDLDSNNIRIKWAAEIIRQQQGMSNFAWLEGKGRGKGTVIYVSKDLSEGRFRVEAVSIADGSPLAADSLLRSNASYLTYKAAEGKRVSIGFALGWKKITQSMTSRKIVEDSAAALAPHWTRQYDALIVNALSAYNYSLDEDTTSANLAIALSPSNAENITSLEAILNLKGIGTSSVSNSSYTGYNAWFCGTAEDGGPILSPDEGTWDDAKANPTAYRLTVNSLLGLLDYQQSRGIAGISVDSGGSQVVPEYVLFAPRAALSALRMHDPDYRKIMVAGDVSAEEMWTGKMRFPMVEGVVLKQCSYTFPDSPTGVTGNSPLRMTSSNDGKHWVVEALCVGAQAAAVSAYDEPKVAMEDIDIKGLGRENVVAYDFIKGAKQIERVSKPNATPSSATSYRQATSVILTMPKFGA